METERPNSHNTPFTEEMFAELIDSLNNINSQLKEIVHNQTCKHPYAKAHSTVSSFMKHLPDDDYLDKLEEIEYDDEEIEDECNSREKCGVCKHQPTLIKHFPDDKYLDEIEETDKEIIKFVKTLKYEEFKNIIYFLGEQLKSKMSRDEIENLICNLKKRFESNWRVI